MSLPINAAVPRGERTHIMFDIPSHFRSLHGSDDLMSRTTCEFIPETDSDPDKWSKIITTQIFLGFKKPARFITKKIIDTFSLTFFNAKSLEHINQKRHNYKR